MGFNPPVLSTGTQLSMCRTHWGEQWQVWWELEAAGAVKSPVKCVGCTGVALNARSLAESANVKCSAALKQTDTVPLKLCCDGYNSQKCGVGGISQIQAWHPFCEWAAVAACIHSTSCISVIVHDMLYISTILHLLPACFGLWPLQTKLLTVSLHSFLSSSCESSHGRTWWQVSWDT